MGELVHPLGDLLTFGILVTAAVIWRKRPEVHKRLMLLATLGSMRVPFVTVWCLDACIPSRSGAGWHCLPSHSRAVPSSGRARPGTPSRGGSFGRRAQVAHSHLLGCAVAQY